VQSFVGSDRCGVRFGGDQRCGLRPCARGFHIGHMAFCNTLYYQHRIESAVGILAVSQHR